MFNRNRILHSMLWKAKDMRKTRKANLKRRLREYDSTMTELRKPFSNLESSSSNIGQAKPSSDTLANDAATKFQNIMRVVRTGRKCPKDITYNPLEIVNNAFKARTSQPK